MSASQAGRRGFEPHRPLIKLLIKSGVTKAAGHPVFLRSARTGRTSLSQKACGEMPGKNYSLHAYTNSKGEKTCCVRFRLPLSK